MANLASLVAPTAAIRACPGPKRARARQARAPPEVQVFTATAPAKATGTMRICSCFFRHQKIFQALHDAASVGFQELSDIHYRMLSSLLRYGFHGSGQKWPEQWYISNHYPWSHSQALMMCQGACSEGWWWSEGRRAVGRYGYIIDTTRDGAQAKNKFNGITGAYIESHHPHPKGTWLYIDIYLYICVYQFT